MKIKTLKLYTPHKSQKDFHASKARFRVLACGRRWGKTLACINEILMFAWENPKSLIWWVAPIYIQTMIAYRTISRSHTIIAENLKSERRIKLINGSVIVFKSADNADSLRGEGLDFLIMDETALIAREAFEESLRPALSDKKGRAVFISTPKGRNYFYELYLRGLDGNDDHESFYFPTASNPYIDKKEIEQARKTLPERVFKQEYLAEFIDDAGQVFSNIKKSIGTCTNPEPPYSIGIDLAKYQDFTVVCVLDSKKQVIEIQRFNEMSYNLQKEKIKLICNKYKDSRITADQTGLGEPILDDLRNSGLHIDGVKFTNESKQALIEKLILAFEKQEITIPDYEPLIRELEAFSYKLTDTGLIKYGAPGGYYDDTVIALALALKGSSSIANWNPDLLNTGQEMKTIRESSIW